MTIEIIDPEATENYVTNPSIEIDTTGLTAVGGAVSRSLSEARFGRASAFINPDGVVVQEGAYMEVVTGLSAVPVTVSAYCRGQRDGATGSVIPIRVRIRLVDQTNSLAWAGDPVLLDPDHWIQFSITGVLGAAAATVRIYVETIEQIQSDGWWVDGYQLENKGYLTTYTDGDLEDELRPHDGDAYFKWSGTKHASRSTRSERYRLGGRPRDVTEGLDVDLWPTDISGFGMPPLSIVSQPFDTLDRLHVQRQRPLPRALMMTFWASKLNGRILGNPAILRSIHKAREALEQIVKPDRVQETQPALIRYTDTSIPMDLPAFYEGGMEFQGDLRFPLNNSFGVRFLTPDPFWKPDSQDTHDFSDGQDTLSANHLFARIDGQWISFDCDDIVRVIEVHPRTGDIYVGGDFTTVDGDADCARICRISRDGQTVTPLDVGIDDGGVWAIAFDPDGNTVYVGGSFLDIDGDTFNRIAAYDINFDAWDELEGAGPPSGLDGTVEALAVNRTGLLYIGGQFTADAAASIVANRICSWTRSTDTFNAMVGANGNGVDATVHGLLIDLDGVTLHMAGAFTQETGAGANTLKRVGTWDESANTYTQMGQDGAEDEVRHLAAAPNGHIYCAGDFGNIGFNNALLVAVWNRTDWLPLGQAGDGLGTGGEIARTVDVSRKGLVLYGGDVTEATGVKSGFIRDHATWNGTRFGFLDIIPPSGTTIHSVAFNREDIWIGGDLNGSTAEIALVETVMNYGKAKAGPILEVLGPIGLYWLENQSTGQLVRMQFEVQDGETIKIDLRQGLQSAVSNFRGNVIADLFADSDLFYLLPGENTIAFLSTLPDEGEEMVLRWQDQHWSFDD